MSAVAIRETSTRRSRNLRSPAHEAVSARLNVCSDRLRRVAVIGGWRLSGAGDAVLSSSQLLRRVFPALGAGPAAICGQTILGAPPGPRSGNFADAPEPAEVMAVAYRERPSRRRGKGALHKRASDAKIRSPCPPFGVAGRHAPLAPCFAHPTDGSTPSVQYRILSGLAAHSANGTSDVGVRSVMPGMLRSAGGSGISR